MKKCGRCRETKTLSEFAWKNKAKGIRQSFCRSCHKEYRREHYEKNRQKYVDKARIWNDNFRKEFYKKHKSHPCVDCKKSYPYYVMQFDHKEDKEFVIAKLIQRANMELLLKEIAKCDLVCANCHAERTHGRL